MRFRVCPIVGLLLVCTAVSCQVSDSSVDDAVDWANSLFKTEPTEKPTEKPDNRFNLSPTLPKTNKKGKSCYTDDQEEGLCVKTSRCLKEAPKVDPATLFVPREKSPCHGLEICCPTAQVREVRVPTPPPPPGCGHSNPGASVFREKVGTSKSGYADFGEFPWMVALMKSGNDKFNVANYLGGGSLIHPSVVMTVAHKVSNLEANELTCRAGEWDTQSDKEAYEHQDRGVKEIVVHNEYNSAYFHNNIALLFLERPFVIEPHINVACLSLRLPAPGTVCYSMGWGEDFTKSKAYANILKKVTLPLVDDNVCQSRYRNTRLGSGYSLHRSLTCAGGEAQVDTCIGDGGSSLVCPINGPSDTRYALVGMVAYGLECGLKDVPGVYAKVPQVYDWVGAEMAKHGFDKSSYEY